MLLHVCKVLGVEFAIANSLGFFDAQSLGFVHFVVAIAAFKEEHFAIAFEGEDVSADAVEEPTVVADYHGTSGKLLQTFL